MSLDRIHHVAIPVADLEKALQWYQTSFECELIQQERQFAVLQFENLRVVLSLTSLEPPHLAFEKTGAAALGELRDRPDGVRSTYVADTTGNMIEIVEKLFV